MVLFRLVWLSPKPALKGLSRNYLNKKLKTSLSEANHYALHIHTLGKKFLYTFVNIPNLVRHFEILTFYHVQLHTTSLHLRMHEEFNVITSFMRMW